MARKQERFVMKNGVRWVNPEYIFTEHDEPDYSLAEALGLTPIKTDNIEEIHKTLRQIDEFPDELFVQGFRNTDIDDKIKTLMHDMLYAPSLERKLVVCPFCTNEVSSVGTHFEKHMIIFTRGCVYCNCSLYPKDFANYMSHILTEHKNEAIHFK